MAKLDPLDYKDDYYGEPLGIYELPCETSGLEADRIEIRKLTRLPRVLMLRHERLMYQALSKFLEGDFSGVAEDMEPVMATMPGLHDARTLAAISRYLLGEKERALEIIRTALLASGGIPMGRFFKGWAPSLRVVIRLDDDLVAPFFPNRLGMCMLAISAYRELGDTRKAGRLIETTAGEYGLIDEILYLAVLLHLELGHHGDARKLLSARMYRNRDSLDMGILLLKAEASIPGTELGRVIAEFRAALQFRARRNPWLSTRGLWRLAMIYRLAGFDADERETLEKIDVDYLPPHLVDGLEKRLKVLPKRSRRREEESYSKRFDYIWRGRVAPDEPVDFLEV